MNKTTGIKQNTNAKKGFLDIIKEKYEQDTVKTVLLVASLFGLVNPFLAILGVFGLFIYSDSIKPESIDEGNKIIGMWVMYFIMMSCSIFIMIISAIFLQSYNISFFDPILMTIPYAPYFVFGAVAVLNALKFLKDKRSYYPKFMVLPLNYCEFIKRIKHKAINL